MQAWRTAEDFPIHDLKLQLAKIPVDTQICSGVQVRNARLAMLATLGFAVQAYVTGKGPLENAQDHLRDPFGANSKALLEQPSYSVTVFGELQQQRQTYLCASCIAATLTDRVAWQTCLNWAS